MIRLLKLVRLLKLMLSLCKSNTDSNRYTFAVRRRVK